MNTNLIPNHLPEPPPVSRHDFELDLLDGDRRLGRITPRAIAFTGFANETEAAHAAWVAYRALARRLARRDGRRPVPIDTEPLRLITENDGRIIYGSRDRVAKLIEPGTAESAANGFGFELRLDAPLDEVSVRAKAHLIYRTLRRSGMKWAMWAAAIEPARPRATVRAPERLRDAEMIIGNPLELRDLAISVVLLALAIGAVIVPGAIGVTAALAAITGLILLRLTLLHTAWPRLGARDGRPAVTSSALITSSVLNGTGGSHAARAT